MVTILLFCYFENYYEYEKTLDGQSWYDLVEKFQSLEIEIEWYKGDCYVLFALLGHDFVGKIKVYFSGLKVLWYLNLHLLLTSDFVLSNIFIWFRVRKV